MISRFVLSSFLECSLSETPRIFVFYISKGYFWIANRMTMYFPIFNYRLFRRNLIPILIFISTLSPSLSSCITGVHFYYFEL
ncbi:hypothetical protein CPB84DRAFT_1758557 [Gymnopilus junonius]|uniref:Uncharacterized protein n=1 Tax=Gymnopilus junonius TaxID=109634 RepID=A0A9P5P3A9_GYMJU|nr:hypothetical protein CPB84DRAFT_1758557 [Gymnopilus junonius]